MAEQDVHGRPDGCVGEQDCRTADMCQFQTYFIQKWLRRKQYSATMAKQLCFKEVALLAQETAAAEDKGKLQAMLFAMLQEQHN